MDNIKSGMLFRTTIDLPIEKADVLGQEKFGVLKQGTVILLLEINSKPSYISPYSHSILSNGKKYYISSLYFNNKPPLMIKLYKSR